MLQQWPGLGTSRQTCGRAAGMVEVLQQEGAGHELDEGVSLAGHMRLSGLPGYHFGSRTSTGKAKTASTGCLGQWSTG